MRHLRRLQAAFPRSEPGLGSTPGREPRAWKGSRLCLHVRRPRLQQPLHREVFKRPLCSGCVFRAASTEIPQSPVEELKGFLRARTGFTLLLNPEREVREHSE